MKELGCRKIAPFARKILTVIMIILLISFVFGCIKDESIVDKLATGQTLNNLEQAVYAKNKASFDEKVAARKKGVEEDNYKPATAEEIASGKRVYKANEGNKLTFNISKVDCEKFGFQAGDRVETPKNGKGYVIGIYENSLWFHLDNDPGASYFSDHKKDDFIKEGFKIISESDKSNAGEGTTEDVETDSTKNAPAKSAVDTQVASSKIDNDEETDANTDGIYFKPIKRIPYLKKEK